MKFLLLSNNDSDGVGQHVERLSTSLNNLGHQSHSLVLHKNSEKNNTIKIKRSILKRIFLYPVNFLKKDFNKLFSFGFSGINLKLINKYIIEADVILIYSFINFLSIDNLEKILQSKKIIYFRPLDMELASGGCHVNFDSHGNECTKYQSSCSNCPQLNLLNLFDLSKKIINKKKKILEKYKPKILVENNFTKKIYENSYSCKKLKIKSIFLGVNKNRINYFEKNKARNYFGFSQDEKILLYGSYNLDAKYKGGEIIKDLLKILSEKLDGKDKINLVTFGRKNSFNIKIDKIKWTHLGQISDDLKLNTLYRSADLMLSPSIGCNGPHMVVEAIYNDLPVIAFDQGVAMDAILNGINGFKVKCFDKEMYAQKIYESLFNFEFNFNSDININLKNKFSSSTEANEIINISTNDLKV